MTVEWRLARDQRYMTLALAQAQSAAAIGEVPVGAVLVRGDEVLAATHNRPLHSHDPTAHAEILALRAVCLGASNYRLQADCELYVTLEPCAMCLTAMLHARLSRLVYAAGDPKAGAAGGRLDLIEGLGHLHRLRVSSGVLAADAAELLRSFFKARR